MTMSELFSASWASIRSRLWRKVGFDLPDLEPSPHLALAPPSLVLQRLALEVTGGTVGRCLPSSTMVTGLRTFVGSGPTVEPGLT